MTTAPERLFDRLGRPVMHRVLSIVGGVPARVVVLVLFALAGPQLYLLPAGTIDVGLSSIVAILLVPSVAVWTWRNPDVRRLVRTALVYSLLGLMAIRILALLWSPDAKYARQPVVLLGQFVVTLVLLFRAVSEEPDLLRQIQFAYWPVVVLQAFTVAVFRVFPGVEDAYLHSIAGLFAGRNTVGGLFDVNRNNVLDPSKSGGLFFVNANVCGLFLGVSAMAAFAVWSITRQRLVLVAGFAALAGVWFTGSKSGQMFSVVLPLAALAAYFWRRLKPAQRRYLLIGAGTTAVVVALVLSFTHGGFAAAVRSAFGQRTDIWGYGAEVFVEHPLLGLGWGGWQHGFAAYAAAHGIYSSDFPPHNILLAAWASTGLVGLALTILLFGVMLRLVVKAFARDSARNSLFVAWTGGAFVWVMVQAMGENTDVFGDIRLIPVLALLLCYLIRPVRQETEGVTDTDIWNRKTSIIPAVRDVHLESGDGIAYLPPALHRTGQGGQVPGRHRRP